MDHIDKMDVGVWDTGYQVKKNGMKPDEVIICQNRCSSVKPHRLCTGQGVVLVVHRLCTCQGVVLGVLVVPVVLAPKL